jgi:cellulose synthase (UDP-forming)
MDDLSTYGPLLVSAGLMLVMCAIFGRNSQACRMIAAALCIFLALRYLWWHATLGMPKGQTLPQQVWAWIFFLFESTANFSSTTVYFFLSRTKDRPSDADAAQDSPLLEAAVDVFIVTYNEPVSVLERTIIGAKAIAHQDLRVFVLDDGALDFIRDLAHDLGAHYVRRVKGKKSQGFLSLERIRMAIADGLSLVPARQPRARFFHRKLVSPSSCNLSRSGKQPFSLLHAMAR